MTDEVAAVYMYMLASLKLMAKIIMTYFMGYRETPSCRNVTFSYCDT